MIRDIIDKNRKQNQKFRILDVGGRGNLLKKFLPRDDIFYIDPYIQTTEKNFIKGDGCSMPLENESFDWVTSADVFEHVPEENREKFLAENIRVARTGVILAAPFFSEEIQEAEKNANENFKILSNGSDHVWLREHIDNGLPMENSVEEFLKNNGLEFQKIYSNRLFLWELFIGIAFAAEKYAGLVGDEFKNLNYFYNSEIFPYDSANPSYRKIYFIKKTRGLYDLKCSDKKIDETLFLKAMKNGLNIMLNIIETKNSSENEDMILQVNQANRTIKQMEDSKFWKLRELYLKLKKVKL